MKRPEQLEALRALYGQLEQAHVKADQLPAITEAVIALAKDSFNAGYEAAMEEVRATARLAAMLSATSS
jgi:hypothetical protein